MSTKHGRRQSRRAVDQPTVLVFGEDENDTRAVRELIIALCPTLEFRVQARRRPLVLIKGAQARDLPDRTRQIADIVSAEQRRRNVVFVFAHQDCDEVEPAHEAIGDRIEKALADAGCTAHAVVPAWEMEAWWFMWPAAVTAFQPNWKVPAKFINARAGLITNAKEEFRRSIVSRNDHNPRRYRESDSPLIAKKVRDLGIARYPKAKSLSWERFVLSVDSCCAETRSGD